MPMMTIRSSLLGLLALASLSYAQTTFTVIAEDEPPPPAIVRNGSVNISTNPVLEEEQVCIGPSRPGELIEALLDGYRKKDRPSLYLPGISKGMKAPPDKVGIQVRILRLTKVDQIREEFELSLLLRSTWHDPRLAYNTTRTGGCMPDEERISFDLEELNTIWKPSIYIDNQASDGVNQHADAIWLYPNGRVLWGARMKMALSCQMEFSRFPYDIQKCSIEIGTFAQSDRQVHVGFVETNPVVLDTLAEGATMAHPHHIRDGGHPEWNIVAANPHEKEDYDEEYEGETYSFAEIEFHLERNSAYYTSFVVQPCVMFVAIGYASFFINRNAAPARVGITTVGFLANTNFLVAQLGQVPRLGRNIWLLEFIQMCVWFSFYSILEYALCNYLRRIQNRLDAQRKKMGESQPPKSSNNNTDEEEAEEHRPQDRQKVPQEEEGVYHGFTKADIVASGFERRLDLLLLNPKTGHMYLLDKHVDVFSRYTYPVAYATACLILWITM